MDMPPRLFRTTSFRECVCLHRVSTMIKLRDDDPGETRFGLLEPRWRTIEQSFVPAVTKAGTVWAGFAPFVSLLSPGEAAIIGTMGSDG